MSDPYWPWWAVLTFFTSGAGCAWILIISRRPRRVGCPNCGHYVIALRFRDHWKECAS